MNTLFVLFTLFALIDARPIRKPLMEGEEMPVRGQKKFSFDNTHLKRAGKNGVTAKYDIEFQENYHDIDYYEEIEKLECSEDAVEFFTTKELTDIKAGDVFGGSEMWECENLLRKVVSISANGKKDNLFHYTVATEEASMEDAIKHANIDYEDETEDDEEVLPTTTLKSSTASTSDKKTVSSGSCGSSRSGKKGTGLKVSCSSEKGAKIETSISNSFSLPVKLTKFKVDTNIFDGDGMGVSAKVKLTPTFTSTLSITAKGEISGKREVQLAGYRKTFTITVGPVTVPLSIELGFYAGVSASAEASISGSVKFVKKNDIVFTFEAPSKKAVSYTNTNYNPTFTEYLSGNLEGNVDAYIRGDISLGIPFMKVDVIEGSVGLKFGFNLNFVPKKVTPSLYLDLEFGFSVLEEEKGSKSFRLWSMNLGRKSY